jgi:putative ABC transport system permease protein
MTRVAIRGLARRKLRALLTAFAIVLGVSMVSGTYVLTDTIDRAFSNVFTHAYAGTDARVTGKSADISFDGDAAPTPPVPAALLDEVRALPDVAAATGTVFDEATRLLDKHGDAIAPDAPTFAFGVDARPENQRFNPTRLVEGRWPAGAHQVVIDAHTAHEDGYRIGETVGVAAEGRAQRFEIVGVARYGGVDSLGNATFAIFDVPTAQAVLHKQGEFDEIFVAGRSGVSPERLVRELEPVLPRTVEVETGAESARSEADEVSSFTDIVRYFLLAFAGIALFVGAFVIFNTLSITVAQRTREFAALRTIGASRRQVLGSVVVEALVIGLISAALGFGLGVGLAYGLKALFAALGAELPEVGMVIAPRTMIVSLLIGVGVTLVAGLAPAIRATHVPPIAAVREGAELPPSRLSRWFPYAGGALAVIALGLLGYSLFADGLGVWQRLLSIAGGCVTLFVGVALLSSRLVRPLVAILGWPARRLGGTPGVLAQRNARRNPGRTAATAAALMIGLALVTLVGVLASGMKESNRAAIEDQIAADYLVTSSDGLAPFVAAAGDAVRRGADGATVTSVRTGVGKVAGSSRQVTGIDPQAITQAYRFRWKDGSDATLASLGREDAVIDEAFADEKELRVGDRLPLLSPSGKRRELTVAGIYEPPPFYPVLGSVSIATATFDTLYDRPRNQFTFVDVPGAPGAAGRHAIETALAGFPDTKVQTREGWIAAQDRDMDDFLTFLYVLLALSVIVSLFGMVNTLVLSVYERTRELGMLRAVGMTRRQARRMVRHESVITALIGAALGLPLGVLLAALITKALSQFEVQLSIPVGRLAVFTLVAAVVGVLAAVLPARRAARLNVLNALQYE